MRFITEFELNEYTNDSGYLANKKYERGMNLGKLIADTFGWDEMGQTTLFMNTTITHKYSISIEAFPMDKWVEFKKRLSDALPDYDVVSRTKILNALAELESFTK